MALPQWMVGPTPQAKRDSSWKVCKAPLHSVARLSSPTLTAGAGRPTQDRDRTDHGPGEVARREGGSGRSDHVLPSRRRHPVPRGGAAVRGCRQRAGHLWQGCHSAAGDVRAGATGGGTVQRGGPLPVRGARHDGGDGRSGRGDWPAAATERACRERGHDQHRVRWRAAARARGGHLARLPVAHSLHVPWRAAGRVRRPLRRMGRRARGGEAEQGGRAERGAAALARGGEHGLRTSQGSLRRGAGPLAVCGSLLREARTAAVLGGQGRCGAAESGAGRRRRVAL